ncbi:IS1 transposase [Nodularia sp. NIES-3585]|nr:IS1 transposase [Nodularia sp. NIES-3585]
MSMDRVYGCAMLRERAIERVKKVHDTTVINWVKEVGNTLPDTPEYDEILEITQIGELKIFIVKKIRFGCVRQLISIFQEL